MEQKKLFAYLVVFKSFLKLAFVFIYYNFSYYLIKIMKDFFVERLNQRLKKNKIVKLDKSLKK